MGSKGLGDTIDKFTTRTGIKSLTQFGTRLAGKKDCGCNKRKAQLNARFPYDSNNNWFTNKSASKK